METLITTRHWEVTYGFPRAGWLKTTEMCSLTVLEAGSLKSRCRQSRASSEGSAGDSALCLLASVVDASLQSLLLLSHGVLLVCLSVSLLLFLKGH